MDRLPITHVFKSRLENVPDLCESVVLREEKTPLAPRLPPCSVTACLRLTYLSHEETTSEKTSCAVVGTDTARGEKGASPKGRSLSHIGGGSRGTRRAPRGRAGGKDWLLLTPMCHTSLALVPMLQFEGKSWFLFFWPEQGTSLVPFSQLMCGRDGAN